MILRFLYTLLWLGAAPFIVLRLVWRARRQPEYLQHLGERLGRYPQRLQRPLIWIHAVSVGETRASAPLVQALLDSYPDHGVLLTHMTPTGRATGEELFGRFAPRVQSAYLPYDLPWTMRHFLRHFRPSMGILMETEVWPNLVAGCRQQGVPLVLANARFNEQSLRKAQRLGWLARPAYGALTAVWAQTEMDAERLRAIGAPVQAVLGNLKFDVEPDAAQVEQGRTWRTTSARPVVMLASSREGEEALWLEALMKNKAPAPAGKALIAIESVASKTVSARAAVQWLIVPRHPQRFDEVYQLLSRAGLQVSRRSQWVAAPPDTDVWLGDSLGEMALYYGLADVALLGGSFAPLGGQNLIEAAACGCPVVLGPHTFNFAQAAVAACSAGAAQRVDGMAQGLRVASEWASDPQRLARGCTQAAQFALDHRGAAQRTAGALADVLAARHART